MLKKVNCGKLVAISFKNKLDNFHESAKIQLSKGYTKINKEKTNGKEITKNSLCDGPNRACGGHRYGQHFCCQ